MNDASQNGIDAKALMHYSIKNVLLTAQRMGISSIAMPAISCGKNCFPPSVCAQTIFKCLLEFQKGHFDLEMADPLTGEFSKNETLQTVRLVNRNPRSIEVFLCELYKMMDSL
uniref:Macro domain-containing protein n=1 Tax=Strombidium rassoulzadegani TaxID=1082188 RepID=A0A7S3CKP4_9SPIT|mmetsp:Transcript_14685/g.25002  ORF Transcript_14685/g.25002 Transcript_14685/m.25002 type:complete len:113 (+) Transcript_14685:526-864(+)